MLMAISASALRKSHNAPEFDYPAQISLRNELPGLKSSTVRVYSGAFYE